VCGNCAYIPIKSSRFTNCVISNGWIAPPKS